MRQDIKIALQKFEVPTFGNKGNIDRLQKKISNEETVIYIAPTNAVITTAATRKVKKLPGVFALTSRRVIFMYKALFDHSMLTLDLSEVKSVNCRGNSLTGGHVEILTMVNSIDILVKYKKAIIESIQNAFDTAIAQYKAGSQPGVYSKVDILAQIEKLSELKDKAIISEDEYAIKKTELLSRL